MAVQAQYPSKVLFQNRNVQEEKAHGGEGFIDQSQILFSNGVSPRKRTRDIFTANSSSPISPFSLQLAVNEQHQQQQSLSSQSSVLYSALSDDLAPQINHQRDEIEQLLHAQGEQLRRTLAEKRQRHYNTLLSTAEELMSRQLKEREIKAQKAAQRNVELKAHSAMLEAEARSWQARARAGETTALGLKAQLQEAMMGSVFSQDPTVEDAGSSYVDPDRVVMVVANDISSCYGGPTCKACRRGVATVVLFPCRHLSLCTDCDRRIENQACPVCFSFKESSVEVYFA